MAKVICNNSGTLQIGKDPGSPDPDFLFAGLQLTNVTCTRILDTIEEQAFEDAYPDEGYQGVVYELTGEYDFQDDDTHGMLGIPAQLVGADPLYAQYQTQHGTPQVCFAGTARKTGARDTQAVRSFEKQTVTLRSTGEPDVG